MLTTDVEYLLSIDSTDPRREDYIRLFEKESIRPFIDNNKSVVDATNFVAKQCHGEILVYLSDDFDCPNHWDAHLQQQFRDVKAPTLLKVDDCLQNFRVGVVTIPIMNRALYKKLRYFWHPEYLSMHVDVDLYETCAKHGFLQLAKHLKFPHDHHSIGKAPRDETYTRSEGNWNQGLEVINRRRAEGFPI